MKFEGRRVIDITDDRTRNFFNKFMFFCGRYDLEAGRPIHQSATAIVIYANDTKPFEEAFDTVLKERADDKNKKSETRSDLTDVEFQKCMQLLGKSDKCTDLKNKANDSDQQKGSRGNKVTRQEFLKYCTSKYGDSQRVVIKFMRHKEEKIREQELRKIAKTKGVDTKVEGEGRGGQEEQGEEQGEGRGRRGAGRGGVEGRAGGGEDGDDNAESSQNTKNQDENGSVNNFDNGYLKAEHVVGLLGGVKDEDFEKGVDLFIHDDGSASGLSLTAFKYGIVMPAADRSLDDILRKVVSFSEMSMFCFISFVLFSLNSVFHIKLNLSHILY